MADKTSIEWTDATWNPIRARNKATGGVGHFCVHASEGCRNCYAERLQPRFRNPIRFAAQDRDTVDIYLDEQVLTQPLRWKRPRRIFPCSMTDIFGDWVTDAMLDRIFAVMALTPQHTYQVLTKRTARMRAYLTPNPDIYCNDPSQRSERMMDAAYGLSEGLNQAQIDQLQCFADGSSDDLEILPNVWLGTSVEDQKTADERIPELLETPAEKRLLSVEPLIGPVDPTAISAERWPECVKTPTRRGLLNALTGWCYGEDLIDGKWEDWMGEEGHGRAAPELAHIDWVILGGESGPNARLMNPDWVRAIRDRCVEAGTAFFFKQWGEYRPIPDKFLGPPEAYPGNENISFDPKGEEWMARVGKHAAGRLLDGRTWDEFPA